MITDTIRRVGLAIAALTLLTLSGPALAWTPVGVGIEYEKYTLPKPPA